RTSAWSSTSRTLNLFPMRLRLFPWDVNLHQRASAREWGHFQRAAEYFRAFPHGHQSNAGVARWRRESLAAILHFQLQTGRQKAQTDPGFSRGGMPRHIIERLL